MSSPMDSKYFNKRSPSNKFSPPKKMFLDESLRVDNDEVSELRRRISRMELEQADRAHEYNEQCSDLQSHVTRLRASVEKGEVLRQKLEYELTLAQKSINQEKRKFAEKELSFQKAAASLKDKAEKLESENEKISGELKTGRSEWEQEKENWKDLLSQRDREISQLKDANRSLAEGQQRLEAVKSKLESNVSELQDKCNVLENQRNSQNDTVRRLMNDVEFSSDREERAKSELNNLQDRLKTAEENVEAERTAHLETKFSSEILQLRVRDLEGALEVEKASFAECKKKLESVSKDYKDIETALEDQRDAHSELKTLMTRKDEQSSLEINELTRELNEKINNERKLSEQLEIHQKNFDSLKNELSQAKKQQTDLQSMYGDDMSELELLLENFQINKNDESKKKLHKSRQPTPSMVLENLRYTLRDYQTRLKNSTAELERLKKTVGEVSAECSTYKEISWTRDKALEEAQRLVKNSHKESARFKAECVKYENDLLQQEGESEKLTKKFAEQKERYLRLRNEYDKQRSGWEKKQEEQQLALHAIYQQLVNGRVFIRSQKDKTMSFSTAELTGMIQEQLQSNANISNSANKKIEELEGSLALRDDALNKLQVMYDDAVKKASRKTKERESVWKKQKSELENHYKKILDDLHSQSEQSQLTLDDVWAKLNDLNQAKEELEAKNNKLRSSLHKSENEKLSLLAASALLSGALWSAARKVENLIMGKRALLCVVKRMGDLKDKTAHLVDVLRLEMEGDDKKNRKPRDSGKILPPILRFRKAVIAVLAVNRIYHIWSSSRRLFMCKEWPTKAKMNGVVTFGGCSRVDGKLKGITKIIPSKHIKTTRSQQSTEGISWLSSPQLSKIICHSMNKLIDKLGKYAKLTARKDGPGFTGSQSDDDANTKSPCNQDIITTAARSAYTKMIQGLRAEFASTTEDSIEFSSGFGGSLVDHLRIGLKTILIDNRERWPENVYISTKTIVNKMNHHILSFTQRLHAAELEKRSLRHDVTRIKKEIEETESLLKAERTAKESLESRDRVLKKKLRELEDHLEDTVRSEKYEAVCNDLRMALEREEQAQGLLEEQTKQMDEMGKRMELNSFKGEAKDTTLAETLKALTTCKNELRTRDENIKNARREITMLDNDNRTMQQNIKEMQNMLRSTARERELLTAFVRSAGTVLEQSKSQAMLSSSDQFDFVLPELVLPSEVLAMDGHGTSKDIRICQDTVGLFLQAQRQALNQIVKLNTEKQHLLKRLEFLTDEVQLNKQNVLQMKDDLRATCQMRDNHVFNVPKLDLEGAALMSAAKDMQGFSNPDSSPRNGFVPLMPQPDSFSPSKGFSGSLMSGH